MNLEKLKINHHEIDYYIVRGKSKKKKKNNLLFLHGYGSLPHFYQRILLDLAVNYDVYVPILYGINYLPQPILKFEEYLQITEEFIHAMSLKGSIVVGHSYGGTIGFFLGAQEKMVREVMAINPMFHQPFDFLRFQKVLKEALADLYNNLGELQSLAKNPDISSRYLYNMMKNPVAYASGAFSATEQKLPRVNSDVTVTILQASRDSMFSLNENVEAELRGVFNNLRVEMLHNYSHNWLLYHQDYASEKILKELHG